MTSLNTAIDMKTFEQKRSIFISFYLENLKLNKAFLSRGKEEYLCWFGFGKDLKDPASSFGKATKFVKVARNSTVAPDLQTYRLSRPEEKSTTLIR